MLSVWNTNSFLDRAQELVKKAVDKHARYTTTELDRSRPVKKGAATRRRLGEQVAVNMHTMGTSFVGKVRDVQQIAEAQIGEGVADMVEFEVRGGRRQSICHPALHLSQRSILCSSNEL